MVLWTKQTDARLDSQTWEIWILSCRLAASLVRLPRWFQPISPHFYCAYSMWPNDVFKCGCEMENACFVIHWKPAKLCVVFGFISFCLSYLYLYVFPSKLLVSVTAAAFLCQFSGNVINKMEFGIMSLKQTEYYHILNSQWANGEANHQHYFSRKRWTMSRVLTTKTRFWGSKIGQTSSLFIFPVGSEIALYFSPQKKFLN